MGSRGLWVGLFAAAVLACSTATAFGSSFDSPADGNNEQQFTAPTPPPGSGVNPQRRDMPNDPNYDEAEPDNTPAGATTMNFFDERFDLFGFPSALTPLAVYGDNGHGHTTGQPQVSGFNAAGAWKSTRGRPDVAVSILDTGIKWDKCGLRDQIRLNKAELPLPENAGGNTNPGAPLGGYDLNGDGVVNVDDYANDPRVGRQFSSCGGKITAKDLINAFSAPGSWPGAGLDNDNNGFVNDIAGWNFFDNNNDPTDRSSYFAAGNHGSGRTEEAVEKGNDADGSIGVCPHCQFVPLRVWDTFVADANNFGMAMIYSADNGIKVIEGADGALYHSAFAEAASQYAYEKGVTQTYSGDDLNTGNHNYPANYNHTMEIQGVVTDVEGLGMNPPSQLNPLLVPILNGLCSAGACLGANIPVKTYFRGANTTQFGGHSSVSMEGPTGSTNTGKAAGAAALVISAAKNSGIDLTADETREILEQTAEDVTSSNIAGTGTPDPAGPGWDEHFGWGRVDLGFAVFLAKNGKIPVSASIDSPDWYAPLVGASAPLTGRIRAHDGGTFHYHVEWGVGLAPTTWTPVPGGSGTTSGAVTNLGTLDLNAVRAALASNVVTQDPGGPVFSATSRNPYQDQFTVRIVATQAGVPIDGIDRKVLTALPDGQGLRPGFPKRMGTGGEAPLRYSDLNGDGVQELVVPTEDGKIHAFEPNGSELPGWPVQTEVHYSASNHGGTPALKTGAVAMPHEPPRGPTIADLDGDGVPEIITAAGLRIYVFEPDGTLRPGFPVRNDPAFCRPQDEAQKNGSFRYRHKCGFLATPAVGRLEGPDKPLDIVAPSLDGHLYALRGNGTALPGFPKELVDPSAGPFNQQDHAELINEPAIGDINGDGKDDIVEASNEVYGGTGTQGDVSFSGLLGTAGGKSTRVYAINGANGQIMPGWPIKPNGLILDTLPLIGPGHNAAIVKIGGQTRIVASVTSGSLATYMPDGTLDRSMQQGDGLNLFESASVGNIQGTPGSLAIVKYQVDAAQAVNLLLVGQNVAYSHKIGAFNPSTGNTLPGFPTITDDYQFLSASNIAKVDPSRPTNQVVAGNGLGMLHAYDGATGQDVAGFPKVTGGWLFAPAALSDDGRMADITREGFLFEWGSSAPACQSEWPSFRHDPQGTGNYDKDGTPPSAPSNGSTATGHLSFVAPGDDFNCGTAHRYDVRTSSQPITAENFNAATPVTSPAPPAPAAAGTHQSMGLPAGVGGYIAIRAVDEQGNVGRPLTVALPGTTGVSGNSVGHTIAGAGGLFGPVISSFSLSPSSFAVGSGGTALSARRRRSVPRGTVFRYTLNKAATARIRIDRLLPGRRVGRRCLSATRGRRSKPHCTRTSFAGTLVRRAKAGSNRTSFSGRLGRRALAVGSYRATITAVDSAGLVSAARHVTFTVARP